MIDTQSTETLAANAMIGKADYTMTIKVQINLHCDYKNLIDQNRCRHRAKGI